MILPVVVYVVGIKLAPGVFSPATSDDGYNAFLGAVACVLKRPAGEWGFINDKTPFF